jgi:hypothetical protein
MNVKVLWEVAKSDKFQGGLIDLFEPYMYVNPTIPLSEYEVKRGEDMRIDLIFQNMYNLDPSIVGNHLQHIDILLYINNIDNPLNITEGMILKYPIESDRFDEFRLVEDDFKTKTKNINKLLAVPNVSGKIDPKRKSYIDNGYAFPPTVRKEPKSAVSIQEGKFYIGGL